MVNRLDPFVDRARNILCLRVCYLESNEIRMRINLRLFTPEYGSNSQIVSLACALRLCRYYAPLSVFRPVGSSSAGGRPRIVFIMY
jgi:hypothetical protein